MVYPRGTGAERVAEKRLFCALRFGYAQACGSEEVLFFSDLRHD